MSRPCVETDVLEQHLRVNSFLTRPLFSAAPSGFRGEPSGADVRFFAEYPTPPDGALYPSTSRWWNYMNRWLKRKVGFNSSDLVPGDPAAVDIPERKDERNRMRENKRPKNKDAGILVIEDEQANEYESKTDHGQQRRRAPRAKNKIKEAKTPEAKRSPKGRVRDGRSGMADAYEPREVEANWDAFWEAERLYQPRSEARDAERFVMLLPPPNVTGFLHLGHALTVAIQDTLTRWHRMNGKNVLWLPGTDHAGIATQVVVEKKLAREEKKSRHDLGRDAFVRKVWEWREVNGNRICKQLRRLGASLDWSRERFTMDTAANQAVTEAFVRMHATGLIYRANRLVSWSCTLRTAISSIEVEHKELKEPTWMTVPGYETPVKFGVLHSFSYPFAEGKGEIVVATTRLETMLGDVAVAVHPDDIRFKEAVGKELRHPFFPKRNMVVIADSMVDPKFGTGAVKITPAHDVTDFACGKRHGLDFINLLNEDGSINENGGRFQGLPRFKARTSIANALEEIGLFKGETPHEMTIALCSRSNDVVEPVMRPQWWIKCEGMATRAVTEVKQGRLQLLPKRYEGTWYHWLENVEDWCISRQLWWGHRIPAYFVSVDGQTGAEDSEKSWVVARNLEDATGIARNRFPEAKNLVLSQDEDVLDTWFSSGLFPLSAMGWPRETVDMNAFYPGTLLETGADILFFWVARMVMLALQLTDQLPFSKVFLHAMVRDKSGAKMSKAKGNVIDPLDIVEGISLKRLLGKLREGNLDPREIERASKNHEIEFPRGIHECGADALRFGLLAYTGQGTDINLDVLRVVAYRKFCNKLWNATKFALSHFGADYTPPQDIKTLDALVERTGARFADRWILSRLAAAVETTNRALEKFEFAAATTALHDFWVEQLCGRYLEMIKRIVCVREDRKDGTEQLPERQSVLAVLYFCVEWGLKLLHPMMPFVTEDLFQRLPRRQSIENKTASIMIERFPSKTKCAHWLSPAIEAEFQRCDKIAQAARAARAARGIKGRSLDLYLLCGTQDLFLSMSAHALEIWTLGQAGRIFVLDEKQTKSRTREGSIWYALAPDLELHIPAVATTKAPLEFERELRKAEAQRSTLGEEVRKLEATLRAPGYERTSPDIQQAHREQLQTAVSSLDNVKKSLASWYSFMSPDQRDSHLQGLLEAARHALRAKDLEILSVQEKSGASEPSKQMVKLLFVLESERLALETEIAVLLSLRLK